mgnify:CR=1 FL=1
MKKKSLSAKKTIHKKIIDFLKDPKIKKIYTDFSSIIKKKYNISSFSVAVSGGPDSLALSFISKCFSELENRKVFYNHVNHNLRPESSLEASKIKKLLKKLDINCKILNWKGKKPKNNIQAKARKKRYELIIKENLKNKIKYIFTAHHQEDNYENFILRLMRGSGLKGLTSFNQIESEFQPGTIVLRPFMSLKKKDLIYISSKVFKYYVKDPTNYDQYYKRSRVRKIILNFKKEGFDFKKFDLTLNNLSSSNSTINFYVNKNIKENSKLSNDHKQYILSKKFFDKPDEIVFRSFSDILRKFSKKYYPKRGKSVTSIINKLSSTKVKKLTLSGCIIEKLNNSVIIYKENH